MLIVFLAPRVLSCVQPTTIIYPHPFILIDPALSLRSNHGYPMDSREKQIDFMLVGEPSIVNHLSKPGEVLDSGHTKYQIGDHNAKKVV